MGYKFLTKQPSKITVPKVEEEESEEYLSSDDSQKAEKERYRSPAEILEQLQKEEAKK